MSVNEDRRKSIELSIFELLCKISIATALALLFVDGFITGDVISIFIEVIVIIVGIILLRATLQKKKIPINKFVFVGFYIIIANAAWITGGGYSVVNFMIYFLVVFANILLLSKRTFFIFSFFAVINIGALMLAEQWYTEFFRQFGQIDQPIEQFSLVLVPFIIGLSIAYKMKQFYQVENNQVNHQNHLLKQKGQELEISQKLFEQSSKNYQTVLDNAYEAVFVVSIENQIIEYANKYALRLYGLDSSRFGSTSILEFIEKPEDYHELISEFEKSDSLEDSRLIHKNISGEKIYVEFNASWTLYNDKRCILLINRDISEKIKLEKQLKKSFDLYKLLSEYSSDIVRLYDSNLNLEYISPSVESQLGYKKEEIERSSYLDLIHPEDRSNVKAYIEEGIHNEETDGTYQYRVKKADGTYSWFESRSKRIFDSNGKFLKASVNSYNIDKRVAANNALNDSLEKYKILAEYSSDIVTLHGPDFKIEYASPRTFELLGYDPETIHEVNYFDLMHPNEREAVKKQVVSEIEKGVVTGHFRFRLRKKDGSYIWLESRVSRWFSENGEYLNSVINSYDVSETVEAHKELQKSKDLYQLLAENSGDIVTMYNADLNCVYSSPAVQDILGFSSTEFLKTKSFSRIHPEDVGHLKESIDSVIKNKKRKGLIRYRYKHSNEQYIWLESLLRPKYNKQGELETLISVARDITQIVEQEELLKKNEELYRFLTENSSDVISLYDEKSNLKYISPSCQNLLGYSDKEFMEMSAFELAHPDDKEKINNDIENYIKNKESDTILRYRAKHKKGYYLWVETHGSLQYNEHGEYQGAIINIKSVDELVYTNQELERQQNNLEKLTKELIEAQHLAKMGNLTFDLVNNTQHWSENVYEIYEVNPRRGPFPIEEELVHPDDINLWRKNGEKILSEGKGECHIRIITPHGNLKYLLFKTRLVYEQNVPVQIIATVQDISRQKKAEEAVREKEELLSKVIQNDPNIIFMKSLNGEFVLANDAMAELYGLKAQELIGKQHNDLHHVQPENKFIKQQDQKIIDAWKSLRYNIEFTTASGNKKWIDMNKIPFEDGRGGKFILGIGSDITHLKAQEKQLQKAQERYELAAIAGQTMTVDWYPTLGSVFIDERSEQVTGYKSEEIPKGSQEFWDIFYPEDLPKFKNAVVEAFRKKKETVEIEYRVRHKNGSIIWILNRSRIWYNKNGQAERVIGTSSDITRIKEYEQKLIEARNEVEEASQVKEDFFSVMSHEIRTPLNSIIGLSHLLRENEPKNDQIKVLDVLKNSSEHLYKLINDILDFNKIRGKQMVVEEHSFNLKDFVRKNCLPHKVEAQNKGLSCEMYIDPKAPQWLSGDISKVKQILDNLMNNALKFTEDGQLALRILCENIIEEEVWLRFEVWDSGIGIPNNRIGEIFNPFKQIESNEWREQVGTGLGLSIVKNLVELLGGTIKVESKENKGTTFYVSLPFKHSEPVIPAGTSPTNKHTVSLKGLKILYTEDVYSNQFVIQSYCASWGAECTVASSGYEALERVAKDDFDIILMDVHMPEMDGYETASRIRELSNYKSIPIVAFTADISDKTKQKIKGSGMNGYVLKPVDPENLYNSLASYISYKPGGNSVIDYTFYKELAKTSKTPWPEIKKMVVDDFMFFKNQIIKAENFKDLKLFGDAIHRIKPIVNKVSYAELDALFKEISADKEFKERLTDYSDKILNLLKVFEKDTEVEKAP
ncbi:MAG: PAS domain S-box protein [Bacteroidota bacterium]